VFAFKHEHQYHSTLSDHVLSITSFYNTAFLNNHSLILNQRIIETGALAEHLPAENFRYTTNNPLLSYSQRKFYEENGYLVIPHLVEDELIEECR
jgi:hypothetical protein